MELPFPVSRETLARLQRYRETLLQWNEKINLVGTSTAQNALTRHFEDSAQLFHLLPENQSVVVDLGSGAGFPGMVLAILSDHHQVHLIESDKRKMSFLQEVARLTGTRVTLHMKRIEAVHELRADVVTARALAPLPQLVELSSKFLHTNSFCLFPKGENYVKELDEVKGWSYALDVFQSLTQSGSVVLKISHLKRDS